MTSRILVVFLVFGAAAHAEDTKAKAAREELERQLSQMVGKQPTRVRIDYVHIDDLNYKLEEAVFELDGRPLTSPPVEKLSEDGTHPVWNGDVSPGKHAVKARLVFANGASVVMSDEGGHKWTVGGDVSFDVHSGIEVRVQVAPKRDAAQRDIAKRFRLTLPAQPVMIAKLDDGSMPDALTKPATADAGVVVVLGDDAKQRASAAAEAKRLAAEEAKRKKEAAAEAKRLAAEQSKQKKLAAAEAKREKAAAALEAKRLAAEEKKRAAQEAAEAKKLAAAEKRRLAEAKLHPELVAQAPVATPEPAPSPTSPEASPEAVDAGAEPVIEDAGALAVAEAPPVDAGVAIAAAPVAPAENSGGPPWLLIGITGGLAAVVFLVLFARSRARPPKLDD